MRITFLAPHDSLNGGVRVIALYAGLLQSKGHQVAIVSSPRRRATMREHARAIKNGRWRELWRRFRPFEGHLAQSGVPCHILDEHRPLAATDVPDGDVVIATWWETALWMASLPGDKGMKVHLVQGYETWGDPAHDGKVDHALRLPNLKIAISRGLKSDIESRLGPLGMKVIPNAVDGRQFEAAPRERRSRPRVGFVYSQAFIKGADRYRRVVELARRQMPGLEVLAFGVDEEIPSVPLPKNTEFHHRPRQDALAKLYASCDAWLFATRVDSFGLPILESMACRTPVIGLPVGAAPDLLADGAGLLVNSKSEAQLETEMADAILALLKGPEEVWLAMSNRAHERAHEYTWQDAADRFEAELFGALETSPAHAA